MTDEPEAARSDQPPESWVQRRAPRAWRPYLLLARVDRLMIEMEERSLRVIDLVSEQGAADRRITS